MSLKKTKSKRSRLVKECDRLMFEVLKLKRGERCEICGESGKKRRLGTFHILSKSVARNIRYHELNLLLACWFPCHNLFHSDPHRAAPIIKRIKELRGENYEQDLRNLNAISPPLKIFRLEMIRFAMEQFLKYGEET